jgi:NAD(P)-dependent dehydrogenase (short-subunit alcohol dehydrogenase family)
MAKVWLITGAGNGLGNDIAQAALAAGDSVVATARKLDQLDALVQQYGDRVRPVQLDVRDADAAQAAVDTAVKAFGRLDVLVNNAGYGQFGVFEQMTPEDFKAVVDTCFYGVVNFTRAALPTMRKQKSGIIFQVSSIGGRMTMPGNSPYHAAKFAVGGFSDSVAKEVAPFGVQICTLEPGGIRTNWLSKASEVQQDILPDYQPSVGNLMSTLGRYAGTQEGDPKRIADLLVRLSDRKDLPKRLILGIDAAKRVEVQEAERAQDAEKWKDATHSTVYPDAKPVEIR